MTSRLQDALTAVEGTFASESGLAGPARINIDLIEIDVAADRLIEVATTLRDHPQLRFVQLSDLCGVDYATYGQDEWSTDTEDMASYSRAVDAGSTGRLSFGNALDMPTSSRPRFMVVYHLLSLDLNCRLRLRCTAPADDLPVVPSVTGIWASANWYEREAFDLFGILFDGHEDLRRILTDYGFTGHPFRKDFPLIGNVEMRYDPIRERVVYEPVSIEPRVLVPRVIREDSRYVDGAKPDAAEDSAGQDKPRKAS